MPLHQPTRLAAVLAAVALGSALAASALARQDLVRLEPRGLPDGLRVSLYYLLHAPEAGRPRAVIVAPWRGSADLEFAKRDAPVRCGPGDMLLMRAMRAFEDAGLAIAFPGNPSDQPSIGLSFRRDARHATDLAAVVRDLRERLPGVPVLVAGDTLAGTSAVHLAARLGRDLDGLLLIGADFNNLRTFDVGRIAARTLVLHHVDDACSATPLIEAREAVARHGFTLLAREGGGPWAAAAPCDALSSHGLAGLEQVAIDAIAAWLAGRPLPVASSERTGLNEEVWFVPARGLTGPRLELTLYRPDGPGPFPLVVISHGRSPDRFEVERFRRRPRFPAQAREFVRGGHAAAVPARSGNGRSGGSMPQTSCAIGRHDLEDPADIHAALDFVLRRPDLDAGRVVLVGQSAGALASQALASHDAPGVPGVINFAGVLRLRGDVRSEACWFQGVIDAFSGYMKTTKVPSLWIYTENDSYFDRSPDHVRAFEGAVRRAGGAQRFELLPPFKADGHALLTDDDGIRHWLPLVAAFLGELGLPNAPAR